MSHLTSFKYVLQEEMNCIRELSIFLLGSERGDKLRCRCWHYKSLDMVRWIPLLTFSQCFDGRTQSYWWDERSSCHHLSNWKGCCLLCLLCPAVLICCCNTISPTSNTLRNWFQRKNKPTNTRFLKNCQSILPHNTKYPFSVCFLLKLAGKKSRKQSKGAIYVHVTHNRTLIGHIIPFSDDENTVLAHN